MGRGPKECVAVAACGQLERGVGGSSSFVGSESSACAHASSGTRHASGSPSGHSTSSSAPDVAAAADGLAVLAGGQDFPAFMAFDRSYVCLTDIRGNDVVSVPIGGGEAMTPATSQANASVIAVDAPSLYWTAVGSGSVFMLTPK